MSKFQSVEELVLYDANVDIRTASNVQFLVDISSLRKLCLSNEPGIDFNILSSVTQLTFLKLFCSTTCQISHWDRLITFTQLRNLHLTATTSTQVQKKTLQQMTHLESLVLRGSQCSAEHMTMACSLRNLTRLGILGAQFVLVNPKFINQLAVCTHLQRINLEAYWAGARHHMDYIQETLFAFEKLPALTSLRVQLRLTEWDWQRSAPNEETQREIAEKLQHILQFRIMIQHAWNLSKVIIITNAKHLFL